MRELRLEEKNVLFLCFWCWILWNKWDEWDKYNCKVLFVRKWVRLVW